jgi:hypothetical protein
MPKTVHTRVSFQNDIAFLSRLSQAVEKDEHMTPEEKRKACFHIAEVAQIFHGVEIRRLSIHIEPNEG